MKRSSSVLVLFEDAESRLRAVRFCDLLVQRFWQSVEFDLHWREIADLQKPNLSTDIHHAAAGAELAVFALACSSEFPLGLRAWIDSWLVNRAGREGCLFDLSTPEHNVVHSAVLRRVAQRAGMDYLTELPESLFPSLADSPDAYKARAVQVSGLLSSILHHRPVTQPPENKP
jgi:hypothetical protein